MQKNMRAQVSHALNNQKHIDCLSAVQKGKSVRITHAGDGALKKNEKWLKAKNVTNRAYIPESWKQENQSTNSRGD